MQQQIKFCIRFIPIIMVPLLMIQTVISHLSQNLWARKASNCVIIENWGNGCLDRSNRPVPHFGMVWSAYEFFSIDDMNSAKVLLSSLTGEDLLFAQRLSGMIEWHEDNIDESVAILHSIGDYQTLLNLAKMAESQGKIDNSRIAHQWAYKLRPEYGALIYADYLWNVNRDQEAAIQVLEYTLQKYPLSSYRIGWLRRLGKFYSEHEQWEKAIQVYQAALLLKPEDVPTVIELGWLYYDHGYGVYTAMSEFQRAIASDPNNGDGYFAIGQLFVREGMLEEADQWFDKALEQNPNNRWWWLARANAARTAGNLEDSLEIYSLALQRFDDFDILHYEMAWAYKLSNQSERAIEQIEIAISIQKIPNFWFYYRAGEIYSWVNNFPKAIDAYKKALNIDPSNKVVQEKLERVLNLFE